MKKTIFITCLLLFHLTNLFSQNNSKSDSLITLIQGTKNDSVKAKLYFQLGNTYSIENSLDSKINAYKLAKILFNNSSFSSHKINNLSRLAYCYFKQNDYTESEKIYKEGIEISKKEKEIFLEFEITEKYLETFINLKPNSELLKFVFALKEKAIKHKNKELTFKSLALINKFYHISSIKKDERKATSDSMLIIAKELNDSNLLRIAYFNLAASTDHQESVDYYINCLQYVDTSSYTFLSSIYNNISGRYRRINSLHKSILYADSALIFSEKAGRQEGVAAALYRKGEAHYFLGNFNEAIIYGEQALLNFKEAKILRRQDMCAHLIAFSYKELGQYKKALEYLELKQHLTDSLEEMSKHKETEFVEQKFNFQIVQKRDSTEIAIKMMKIDSMNAVLENEKMKKYLLYGGVSVVLCFAIFLFIGFQRKKRANLIIAEQKIEVEEKNKEITDSIQYAKRIQNAILPSNKLVKEYLKNSFIIYLPKDIVAGDFYWMESVLGQEEKNNVKVLFAAADCTGHGVPGAMVSVVCNNGLNRSVREHGLTDPGEILDKTREIVVQEFEKSEDEVKDGMDIALCCLEGKVLKYAGANNPLWIIREGELMETKANKQPIGQFDNPEPYTTHTIELQKGDSIYIFSDGYADQFGGEKGKKMKTANFKKLLLSIQEEPMDKQRDLINKAFEDWKGNLEQLDDVCVIGLSIS